MNLDRFNLFFPEKRPFFLENAGFFSVGNPGEVELFFSRRIGLGNSGEAIPIIAGGRVSGKAGKYNVGLLNMQTNDLDNVAAEQQLLGGADQPRSAEPVDDRRHRRQSRSPPAASPRTATTTRPSASTAGWE